MTDQTPWFCTACGTPGAPDGRFCTSCGTPRQTADVPVTAAPAAAPSVGAVQATTTGFAVPRNVLLIAAGLLAIALVAVVLVVLTRGASHTLTGSFTVLDDDSVGCLLSDGYDDVTGGATVAVENSEGKTVALGHLDEGEDADYGCDFSFTVEDVPASDNYGVTISHRGTLRYTSEELDEAEWHLELTLGDD